MGGLVAVFQDRNEPVDRRFFESICTAVRHRHPDGIHAWHGDGAAVARLRFVTCDEDDSPVIDTARDLVVALDGRIDNREELIATLGLRQPVSDSALVFEAVARWDTEAPSRILGDFAFIAWSPRRRRALLARDHMGIRPLHFARTPRRTICGTDLPHILADPSVPRRPNRRAVAEHLACSMSNDSRTLYEDISRVPPAHVVILEDERVTIQRYWSAEPRQRVFYRSDSDYAAHCRELLVRSVAARMRSPYPVAATLSGGIDSSAVALTASLLVDADPPPRLFSMVFPGHPESDEREFIDAVAGRCGTTPVFVPPAAPRRSLEGRADTWMHLPSMAADAMAEGMWEAMSARGHRVALTGAGGDFAYAGSIFHYADLLRSGRVLAFARRYRDNSRAHDTGQGSWAWLQAGLWPALPLPMKRALRPLARSVGSRAGLMRHPSWLRLPLEPAHEPERPRGGLFAVEDLVRSLTGGLHNFFLEAGERAGAEALVEARHPLLDVRLTEFVLAIPEEQRRRGPILKFVLRKALERELPPALATRTTKGDFAHCVWTAVEGLGGEAFFRSLTIADAGWVDGERVLDLYRRMRDDVPRGPEQYGRHIPEIWMIVAVELWHRSAFGGIMTGAMDDRAARPAPDTSTQPRERRPYSSPRLIEYGSVTQLTAGSLSRQSDAPFSGFKKLN